VQVLRLCKSIYTDLRTCAKWSLGATLRRSATVSIFNLRTSYRIAFFKEFVGFAILVFPLNLTDCAGRAPLVDYTY